MLRNSCEKMYRERRDLTMGMVKHLGIPSFLIISFIITSELIVISRTCVYIYIYIFFFLCWIDYLFVRASKLIIVDVTSLVYTVYTPLIIIFYTLYKLRDKLYGCTYYEEDYI